MPYALVKQGDQTCVKNTQTGDMKGCSSSHAEAVAHMRLLYGIENGSIKKEKAVAAGMMTEDDGMIDQPCCCEACVANSIDPESAQEDLLDTSEKAVWTTKFINSLPDSSFAYIEPGCKDKGCRHFPIKDADGKCDAAHTRNALARASQSPFGSKAMSKIKGCASQLGIGDAGDKKELDGPSIVQQVIDGLKSFVSGPASLPPIPTESRPVVAFKQADGRVRVMMRVSNNFKDRHNEIITEAAHKEYEQYVASSGDYPEFRLWHQPVARWGQADLVSYDDGFMTMSGLADPGFEDVAMAIASRDDMGVSHGFKGISVEAGQVNWYRDFEASPLPRDEAANYWTNVELVKQLEKGMALQDKHKTFFTSLGVPAEKIAQWDASSKSLQDMLKEAGIEFKEIGDGASGTESAAPAGTETPAPKEAPATSAAGAGAETVEVTLADGSKATVPAGSVTKQKDVMDDAPAWAKALMTKLTTVEEKNKELETGLKGLVASQTTVDSWEAAIQQGKGFVASKEGTPPSSSETQAQADWEKQLVQLLGAEEVVR